MREDPDYGSAVTGHERINQHELFVCILALLLVLVKLKWAPPADGRPLLRGGRPLLRGRGDGLPVCLRLRQVRYIVASVVGADGTEDENVNVCFSFVAW